jgi:hypothetical protein
MAHRPSAPTLSPPLCRGEPTGGPGPTSYRRVCGLVPHGAQAVSPDAWPAVQQRWCLAHGPLRCPARPRGPGSLRARASVPLVAHGSLVRWGYLGVHAVLGSRAVSGGSQLDEPPAGPGRPRSVPLLAHGLRVRWEVASSPACVACVLGF